MITLPTGRVTSRVPSAQQESCLILTMNRVARVALRFTEALIQCDSKLPIEQFESKQALCTTGIGMPRFSRLIYPLERFQQ